MNQHQLLQAIEQKYAALGEQPETYLKGLLHAQPINYWDYIGVDTLLSLQRPRTAFKDEEIFIMYHQVTELILKMMLHEIKQLQAEPVIALRWIDKLNRLNRYTNMLITSFEVMRSGMSYEDYNTFRSSLAPASGFQSVQFRFIEIYCTRLQNLVNDAGKSRLSEQPTINEYFEQIYWKDAGLNRSTGAKTLTLQQFEARYQEELIRLAQKVQGATLEEKIMQLKDPSPELIHALREFDQMYNVAWPMVHLNTARHYLDSKGENKAATGGSEWKKYLHPQFQQRKFFPQLWTAEEKNHWGQ